MHNLGGFDYRFILSALSYYKNEYLLVPLIKEDYNLLVSLKICKFVEINNTGEKGVNKKTKTKVKEKKLVRKTIKILDSNQIIPVLFTQKLFHLKLGFFILYHPCPYALLPAAKKERREALGPSP
jgi:hypothetical protein